MKPFLPPIYKYFKIMGVTPEREIFRGVATFEKDNEPVHWSDPDVWPLPDDPGKIRG